MQLTRDQVNTIIKNAPVGSNKSDIIGGLIERGYDIEGIDTNEAKQVLGITTTKTGYSDTGEDIKQIGTDIKTSFEKGKTKINEAMDRAVEGKQGALETTAQQIGAGLGTASSIFGDLIKGAIKVALPNEVQKGSKEVLSKTIETVLPAVLKTEVIKGTGLTYGDLAEKYDTLDERGKANVDALIGAGQFALDLTGLGIGGKAVKTGTKVAGEALETAGKTALKAGEEVVGAGGKLVKTISPQVTTEQAVKQVLQGSTKNISKATKGLLNLDTTGVKTFKDLGDKISTKITELATKVDEDLAKDTTKKILDDLVVTGKTTSGQLVSTNPVKTSLEQLEELYQKIGDDVSLANIRELKDEATKTGLTKLQINNLAKTYGQEFSNKAFSKTGDALTSVNAQMYENTRKNLKNLAREGITGEEAKAADQAMSNLYNTQGLVKRNIEAVNKLQNKIQERGLLEKAGYYISKYVDVLSGGTIRGVVGGILPRGAGYKVMNAVDLESNLAKNLKIIRDAMKSESDDEIIKLLKSLNVK